MATNIDINIEFNIETITPNHPDTAPAATDKTFWVINQRTGEIIAGPTTKRKATNISRANGGEVGMSTPADIGVRVTNDPAWSIACSRMSDEISAAVRERREPARWATRISTISTNQAIRVNRR